VFNPLLQFLLRKPYGVHSPFVYHFAEHCLYGGGHHPDFKVIESLRREYLCSSEMIEVTDLGAGPRFTAFRLPWQTADKSRSVSSIARKVVQKPGYLRLFYRMAAYLQPQHIIELGTCFGISALSFALGNPKASIHTIEGCPETARIAAQTFKKAGIYRIRLHNGSFKETLPVIMQEMPRVDMVYIDGDHTYDGLMQNFSVIQPRLNQESVVIVDDIRWSRQMWKAWQAIASHPAATVSVDLGRMGLLFFRKELSVQKIRLWF
jgi:predicted O-methyltransferase YrrM